MEQIWNRSEETKSGIFRSLGSDFEFPVREEEEEEVAVQVKELAEICRRMEVGLGPLQSLRCINPFVILLIRFWILNPLLETEIEFLFSSFGIWVLGVVRSDYRTNSTTQLICRDIKYNL